MSPSCLHETAVFYVPVLAACNSMQASLGRSFLQLCCQVSSHNPRVASAAPPVCPGFKFERVGAPQPAEMASIAADRALEMLRDVDKDVVSWFRSTAQAWLAEVGDPEEALALALAKITGTTGMKARSLLTAHEDVTTLLFK